MTYKRCLDGKDWHFKFANLIKFLYINRMKTTDLKTLLKYDLDKVIKDKSLPSIKYSISVHSPSRKSIEKRVEIDILQMPISLKKYSKTLQYTDEYRELMKMIKKAVNHSIPSTVSTILVK